MSMWKDVVGGDWECVSASIWEMRCNGAKVMWQGEKDVVAERCDRSGGKRQ
jgi:hypothetical protein